MGLAAISYRGLVSACVPYAETVKAAFDVYRQGLLTAIGWHAAPGLEAERYQWAQVGGLWYRINQTILLPWATGRSGRDSRCPQVGSARLRLASPARHAPEPNQWPTCGARISVAAAAFVLMAGV
jgi:hypothetical protein